MEKTMDRPRGGVGEGSGEYDRWSNGEFFYSDCGVRTNQVLAARC